MYKTIIKNAFVAAPGIGLHDPHDILLEEGKIKKIAKCIDGEQSEIVDATNLTALPGFIDMHCSILDPGYENIENTKTALMSAAKGGFTSITCEPDTHPVIDNKTVVQYIFSQCEDYYLIHVYPYGNMTVGGLGQQISEVGEMVCAGIAALSDGGVSVANPALLRNIFQYSKMFDIPVITHCMDDHFANSGVNEGYISTSLGLKGMPNVAEEIIVARNIILCEDTNSRLHIAHISAKGSVQLIREAKARGVNVTCETCPHYFTLTDEDINDYNTLMKVNPPLRTEADTKAIIEGLRDGTIDVIASGHSPFSFQDKSKEFDNAAFGISALETCFAASYSKLVVENHLDLLSLVEKISINPAKILGLKNTGEIKEGFDADIALLDLVHPYRVEGRKFFSKAKFSPFEGHLLKGDVKYTIVGGRVL